MNFFYITVVFIYLFHFIVKEKKRKKFPAGLFLVLSYVALFLVVGIHFPVDLSCDQMEEGEQYNEHLVERNPRAYMSKRDYRNQWMSSPYGSTYNHSWGNHTNSSWEPRPSQYAPPPHPQHASLSQPQPPQPISLIEQSILDLTKLVGDVVEEPKKFNAQLNQRIHTVENSLDHKLDGLQSGIDHKIDNLHTSIQGFPSKMFIKRRRIWRKSVF